MDGMALINAPEQRLAPPNSAAVLRVLAILRALRHFLLSSEDLDLATPFLVNVTPLMVPEILCGPMYFAM